MDWLLGFIGGGLVQIAGYYAGLKALGLLYQILLLLSAVAVTLGFFWLVAKQPHAALVVMVLAMGSVAYYQYTTRPVLTCPAPFSGRTEVSSKWTTPNRWDRYWMVQKLPPEWRTFEALIRIRIGTKDLFIVHRGGEVYVLGLDLPVKAVEPVTGP